MKATAFPCATANPALRAAYEPGRDSLTTRGRTGCARASLAVSSCEPLSTTITSTSTPRSCCAASPSRQSPSVRMAFRTGTMTLRAALNFPPQTGGATTGNTASDNVAVIVNGRFLRAQPTGLHRVGRALLDAVSAAGLSTEVLAPPGVTDPRVDRHVWAPPGRMGDHAVRAGVAAAGRRPTADPFAHQYGTTARSARFGRGARPGDGGASGVVRRLDERVRPAGRARRPSSRPGDHLQLRGG